MFKRIVVKLLGSDLAEEQEYSCKSK
jgi:hypothetical protein